MSATPESPAVTACEVRRESSLDGLDRLRPEWDRLYAAMGDAAQPFWCADWIRAHVTAFERTDRLRIFAARRAGELVALLPLVRERVWFRGVPARRLRSPAGNFSVRFDLPALPGAAGDAGVGAIARALALARDWDVVELRDVPEGGAAMELLRHLASAGHPTGTWPSCRSPYVDFPSGPGAAPPRPLSRNLRAQLSKHRRQLEAEGGPLEIERLAWNSDAELREHLLHFYELEDAGWKGRNRSSILARPGARRFCDVAAIAMAARGQLALHRLQWGSRTLAMAFSLWQGGVWYAFKWAYDENFAHYGAGNLLIEMLLKDIAPPAHPPLRRFDFTGENDAYKQKWAAAQRPHVYALAFRRGWRGRLLHSLKFARLPRRAGRRAAP